MAAVVRKATQSLQAPFQTAIFRFLGVIQIDYKHLCNDEVMADRDNKVIYFVRCGVPPSCKNSSLVWTQIELRAYVFPCCSTCK